MSQPGKTRILLDFSPIRAGGAVQLALNFLQHLPESPFGGCRLVLLLPGSGALKDFRPDAPDVRVVRSHAGLLRRAVFEHTTLQKILRKEHIDVIYTFLGPGPHRPASLPCVAGVAYPIMCYPDSPFWKHVPKVQGAMIRFRNRIRRRRLRRATRILAETPVMQKRLAKAVGVPIERISVLPPAVSEFVQPHDYDLDRTPRRILILSGNAVHKNLWRLYDVAEELLARDLTDFTFVLSVNRESWLSSQRTDRTIRPEVVQEHFEFPGSVHPSKIDSLYAGTDLMMNISDLESFSNNYMEAWKAGMPQIASDRDFARWICRDSAVYVDPHDPPRVAEAIARVFGDAALRKRMVQAGKQQLAQLPSVDERTLAIHSLVLDAAGV